jgi:RNA polymerase sigma-70 factor, ECF subfamily
MRGDSQNRVSDTEAVLDVLSGKTETYKVIVERYQQSLFRYTMMYVHDYDAAQDILQEAFIKMYRYLRTYDTARPFGAWAKRITHREVLNYVKKANRLERKDDSWFADIPDNKPLPEELLTEKMNKEVLYKAIDSLPMKYREVILLYYFDDNDYESIAEILRLPVSTVSTRLMRAKARVKKQLKKDPRQ